MIYYLDLFGTLVFAISGAMSAAHKRFDIFGAVFIGSVTAIGGGTIRDILLGITPVTWMNDINYFIAIGLGVFITYLVPKLIWQLKNTLFLFDTIGISVFTIIGLNKSLAMGIHPFVAIIMGMFTAVLGGVMRDTLSNDIPLIFKKEIYATACISGALLYLALHHLNVDENILLISTMLLISLVRTGSVVFHLSLPRFNSYEPGDHAPPRDNDIVNKFLKKRM
ncbi:MAG: trimeric intracellular cation channel family protein [Bacteroidales bacterium]